MKDYSKKSQISHAIGVYPTLELLQFHIDKVTEVLIHSNGKSNEGIEKIKALCSPKKIPVKIHDGFIQKMAMSENCYAIGVFNKYESSLSNNNHLLLDNPSDMGNLGTIIRTMIGFNYYDLGIIRPGLDVFNPKVIRASMGAVFQINFSYFSNFNEYKNKFKREYYPFMLHGTQRLEEIKFVQPHTLIFGNEGSGLNNDYMHIGKSVKIAQNPNIDSLNLSVAVGISLHHSYKTS